MKSKLILLSSNDSISFNLFGTKQFTPSTVLVFPDLKALMGDSSDNIKGVPGIGPKSAIKLINQFNDVETLLNNLDQLEEKYQSKIKPVFDKVKEYKKLTKIMTESYPNHLFKIDAIKTKPIKKQEVIVYLNELSIFNVADLIKRKH